MEMPGAWYLGIIFEMPFLEGIPEKTAGGC